jgi:hypothetical protein
MGSGVVPPPWPPGRPNLGSVDWLLSSLLRGVVLMWTVLAVWLVCVFCVLDECCARYWFGADWAIRTSQLLALLPLHLWPIDVLVLHGPQGDLV